MVTQDLGAHTASRVQDEASLYKQVAFRISELIEHGTLRPGERVPSVRRCSEQQKVSIATVMQAYRLLESRGLIEARPQSGYYVRLQRWTPSSEPPKTMPVRRPMQVKVSDLVLQVVKAGRDPDLIRLGATLPPAEIFPVRELNRITASVGRRYAVTANSYDAPPGHAPLRVQIARRAMEAGCLLAPDDIITTVGATEALNLCLRAVARPGDIIAIESPTFFGILQIIEALGMRVCEVPTYPRHGVCLDELEERLKCCQIKACVFTLNYSNPLGSCMPDEKKQALVKLLARYKVPLIEDDIYGNFNFDGQRPRVAKAFDEEGWVMLCDSFTKTISPGSRVGWVAPGRFKQRVEFLKFVNTSATASLPQMAIAEFLQNGGFDHHLRKMRRFYAEQMEKMSHAVSRYFPPGTAMTRPTGGMCLWVQLSPEVDAMALYHEAMAAKITIAPGSLFSAGGKFPNYIRLNCGNPWSEAIDNAVCTLGRLVSARTNKQPQPAGQKRALQAA